MSLFIKYHSYYQGASFLPIQRFNIFHNHRFELYSIYDERFASNVKINWPYRDCGTRIVGGGSVHGILCLSFTFQKDFILCNPSTKDYKFVPLGCNHHECYQKSYIDCGFDYDSIEDDYKVMCIYHLKNLYWKFCFETMYH